jgi:hypothetical protein
MKRAAKAGRVIRRYKRGIAIEDFNKWQDRIRRSARGCGLYALYDKKRLIYVGLATQSIRTRIKKHRERGIPFTHFSVFLVTGSSRTTQGRRIRDLEALLLNVLKPVPSWNKSRTRFVSAKKLTPSLVDLAQT